MFFVDSHVSHVSGSRQSRQSRQPRDCEHQHENNANTICVDVLLYLRNFDEYIIASNVIVISM